jgi:hypothetical protein
MDLAYAIIFKLVVLIFMIAIPDICIAIDTATSIKISTCELSDSQLSFTYWSDVNNCSDIDFYVYNASTTCNLRDGEYVAAGCNVFEGTPSATPFSEPVGSAPTYVPYLAPVHTTPISTLPAPPKKNNALETTINLVLLSCMVLIL